LDTGKINVAFLTNNSEYGTLGYNIVKKYLHVVYKNFGEKEIKLDNLDVDYLISFCYPYRVNKHILNTAKNLSINFHPAPLPEYKGFSVYNFGIMNEEEKWGTTAHIMEEKFDTGPILRQNKFPICKQTETAFSLREKSRFYLTQLLESVVKDISENVELTPTKQQISGNYYSKKMMNNTRIICHTDDEKTIDKKITIDF